MKDETKDLVKKESKLQKELKEKLRNIYIYMIPYVSRLLMYLQSRASEKEDKDKFIRELKEELMADIATNEIEIKRWEVIKKKIEKGEVLTEEESMALS